MNGDVAGPQFGDQHLGHIGKEGVAVHRPIEQHGHRQASPGATRR